MGDLIMDNHVYVIFCNDIKMHVLTGSKEQAEAKKDELIKEYFRRAQKEHGSKYSLHKYMASRLWNIKVSA